MSADRERALAELSRKLEAVLAHIAQGVNIIDADGRVVLVNRGFMELYGFPPELAAPGTPIEAFVRYGLARRAEVDHQSPEFEARVGRRVQQLLASGTCELEEQFPDGRIIEIRRQQLPEGLLVSTYSDVTEQRRAAAELRESEERFRAIAEGVPVPVAISRADISEMLFANERALEIYSVPAGADRDAILSAWVDPKERLALVADVARLGRIDGREVQLRRPDGTPFWALVSARATTFGGHPAVLTASIDINERRRVEEELRETEERLRAIAEGVPLPLVITRLHEPETLFVNDRARETFGLEVGDTSDAIVGHWAQPGQREDMVARLQADGRIDGFEAQLRRADGATFWALISARLMTFGGREAMLVAVTDITEHRNTERALRESEARLAAFMENAPVGMYVKDRECRYVLINPETAKLVGAKPEQMLGRTIADSPAGHDVAGITAHDHEVLRSGRMAVVEEHLPNLASHTWDMVIRFPIRDGEGRVTHIGGFDLDISDRKAMEQALKDSEQRFRTIAEAHPVPMTIARVADHEPLFVNAAYRELFQVGQGDLDKDDATQLYVNPSDRGDAFRLLTRQGRVDGLELPMRRTDGTTFPASLSSRLIDYEGYPAAVTSFTDLTDKRHAEEEIARQRDALHQTEKISALGTLLAGVAHELNNPLSVVVGQSILLEETAKDEAVERRATKIRAAADRCARIVQTFLTMARSRPMERGPVNINALIDKAIELLAYGLRTADIVITRDLAETLPPVWGEGDQLHQVLTNLIINAQHALQEVDPPRELRLSTRREGQQAQIEVADNGPGIETDLAKRVFEPFVTTKPTGVGTGIGLSVCHGIVRAHGGSIELTNRTGGATFVVRLPLQLDQHRASATGASISTPTKPGRVLVVDDEPDVGQLYAEILQSKGHEVVVANSGREALRLLENDRFDLIVSDLRMPDIDGPSLYRALADSSSSLLSRIIFTTGDTLSHHVQRFVSETNAEVLEKPVAPKELLARVDAKLATSGADS